jgi:hypothetical protein
MKSSLWIVIVLVTGIVGFLVGYSVSSSTGTPARGKDAAHTATPAPAAPAAGYGAEPAAPAKPASPGYGAEPAPAKAASAGGYR